MSILRAYKIRIYPNADQESRFAQAFGAARWIFNHLLHENKTRFQAGEKHLSGFDCNKIITQLKKETDTAWLKDVDDWVLKNASSNLDTAYKNFFTSVIGKRKGPKVSEPKYKRKGYSDSFRTTCKIDFATSTIKIPKIRHCTTSKYFLATSNSSTVDESDLKYICGFMKSSSY